MTQTQHTKGPWTMRRPVDCTDPRVEYWIDGNGPFKGPVADIKTSGAPEANARLIAAAPQLLKTLETIASFASGNGDVCEIIAGKARTAIKAATEG